MLNIRSGVEDLVVRNSVAKCKQTPSTRLGAIALAGIWKNCDVEFQLLGLCQQGGVCVNVWAWPYISLTAIACHWSRTMQWDGRAETDCVLTDLSKQKVQWWAESRSPSLPAWPETRGTFICLMILFRVLGGSCGASFRRLMDPVSILCPSTSYLMQQR